MNLSANDWGLIYDAISWELKLRNEYEFRLPQHQRRPLTPLRDKSLGLRSFNSRRMIRLREIQLKIDRYLNGPADDN